MSRHTSSHLCIRRLISVEPKTGEHHGGKRNGQSPPATPGSEFMLAASYRGDESNVAAKAKRISCVGYNTIIPPPTPHCSHLLEGQAMKPMSAMQGHESTHVFTAIQSSARISRTRRSPVRVIGTSKFNNLKFSADPAAGHGYAGKTCGRSHSNKGILGTMINGWSTTHIKHVATLRLG